MKLLPPLSYVCAVVAANVLTERIGLVSVGFGQVTTAGTFAAAWAIVSRNLSQDAVGRRNVILLMLLGVVLSWYLASPGLALASGVAFAISESVDMAVYTPLRQRGRIRALFFASSAGAVVDTFVFLLVAGFPLSAALGQLLVKVGMGLVAAGALRIRHALLR